MADLLATFGVNWKLLVIQAFNFGALLAILTYFLYRPVLNIIDERRAKIIESVKTAEAADAKLKEAKRDGESMVAGAARDAERLVAAARVRAEEKGSEIVKASESKAERLLLEALERAEESERQALRESQREIARAAMLAAEKILQKESA